MCLHLGWLLQTVLMFWTFNNFRVYFLPVLSYEFHCKIQWFPLLFLFSLKIVNIITCVLPPYLWFLSLYEIFSHNIKDWIIAKQPCIWNWHHKLTLNFTGRPLQLALPSIPQPLRYLGKDKSHTCGLTLLSCMNSYSLQGSICASAASLERLSHQNWSDWV